MIDTDKMQLDKLSKMMTDKKLSIADAKVSEIIENEDGSAKIVFDVSKDFKTKYMQEHHLKRWSQKHFEKHITESIKQWLDQNDNRQVQNPDFLWTTPKDNNE